MNKKNQNEQVVFGLWLSNYCTSVNYDLWHIDATGERVDTETAYELSIKNPKGVGDHPDVIRFMDWQNKQK